MRLWQGNLAVAILSSAAVAGGFFGGAALLDHVQFAKAESQVDSARQEVANVQDLSSVFREVGKIVEPSVVKIEVIKTIKVPHPDMDQNLLRKFFNDNGQDMPDLPDNNNGGGNQEFQQEGTGSGVIMETADGYGYILTNNHVAGGATDITITLNDGRIIEHGRLLGADPKSDLAVVRIKADDLIAAHWGNSDDLQQGDWVLAFGSPLGYAGSMTHGIVSALNRNDVHINDYENFIQVDAPINPGNSGGPLVNLHGEVVGVNTAIASNTGFFNGIGFAIPSNQAQRLFATLKTGGKVVRGWLGIGIRNISDDLPLAQSFGFHGSSGVLVTQIGDGTPANGKLIEGDIITAYNGRPVANTDELRNAVAATAPGTSARLTIFRDNHSMDVNLTIGNQPEDLTGALREGGEGRPAQEPPAQQELDAANLGLHLRSLSPEVARQLNLPEETSGAVITNVKGDSLAAQAGLRPGMVITEVGRSHVHSARQAYDALAKANLKDGVRLAVLTDDGSDFVFLQQQENSPSNN